MMTKRLKKINRLVYICIALSLCIIISKSIFLPFPALTGTGGRQSHSDGCATHAHDTYAYEYFCADIVSRSGFRPVPEECPNLDNNAGLYDNLMYRKWCEETFDNGKHIYEAYRDIAFNIKYTPEPAETDIWQTPFETGRSKKGDCEDAVFVFFSHLSSKQKNAMIIWGWVIDRESRVARAHVWYQLIDKRGQRYIVEGFSKDWNGIIPLEIVEETESRKPIFSIIHSEASRLASLTSRPDSWQAYQSLIDLCSSADFIEYYSRDMNISQGIDTQYNLDYEVIEYLLNTQGNAVEDILPQRYAAGLGIPSSSGKEISNIFEKLHELFTRCEDQKEDPGSYLQIADGSIINKSSNRNMNCRR